MVSLQTKSLLKVTKTNCLLPISLLKVTKTNCLLPISLLKVTKTQNGLLQFAGEILKPNYNSLDLVEVELVDDAANEGPRQNSSQLFLVRLFY